MIDPRANRTANRTASRMANHRYPRVRGVSSPRGKVRLRLLALLVVFVILCVAILARAVQLQVIDGGDLARLARREYARTISLLPWRGTIYDRKGEDLAVSCPAQSLYADPFRVKDAPRTAAALAGALQLPEQGVLASLTKGTSFVWLKRLLTEAEAKRVEQLRLPGVGTLPESKRHYPNGTLAAHVLGFAGRDAHGLEGLERRYEDRLAGTDTSFSAMRDAKGRLLLPDGVFSPSRGRGNNLILTLDKTIQYIAERSLGEAMEKTKAKAGTVLVTDPRTGEILALANAPRFDPNAYGRSVSSSWRNRAVSDSFEPGSTFKAVVLAAALEEGLAKETDVIDCEDGSYHVGKITIHDVHEHGRLTLAEVMKFSSNIGAAKLADCVGRQRLFDYITRFGFGSRTGLDLPGETCGILRPLSNWTAPDIYTHSFGQGLSVSAMQMAAAYGAIANGGNLMRPYVVKQVVSPQGVVLQRGTPTITRRVISAQTARRIRDVLSGVCDFDGTGPAAAVPGMRVCGKTGTAQKVDRATGRYCSGRYTASFVGMLPAEDPRLLILVVLDEPGWPYYGGLMAGPVFKGVAEQTLAYLGNMPGGAGPMLAADARQGTTARPEMIVTDEDVMGALAAGKMPDFRGMTQRRVLRLLGAVKVGADLSGSGFAATQWPAVGSPLAGRCRIGFSPS
ncbi:MAG: penicillin-binding transpeptidase domain-containing protein [Pseudomonadota bacterium]